MNEQNATTVLQRLQQLHIAPRGERALDMERATAREATTPEPVLLVTNAALYSCAPGTNRWTRLPIHKVRRVAVNADPTGMLTHYRVFDDEGGVWFEVAVPLARPSFRERMERIARVQRSFPRVTVRHHATGSRATTNSWTALVA